MLECRGCGHEWIDLSRPAVAQAEENNRLVRVRAKLGDATTAEITDSESTLTPVMPPESGN